MLRYFTILIPKGAIADFAALHKKAHELNEVSTRGEFMFWFAPRGAEIAFNFEHHSPAGMFVAHCARKGISHRAERIQRGQATHQ
jgi:hypothetical protein